MKIGRFGDEPDFINEQGVKWWAIRSWSGGEIWMTQLPSGEQEYVALREGQIVASSTALDAVAVKLEMLAAAQRYGLT